MSLRTATPAAGLSIPAAATATIPAPAPTPLALSRLAQDLAGRTELWRPLLHVDPEHRWYTRLAAEEGWEAWLLTWLPGQRTGLHDHGTSAGAFTVLAGTVDELTPVPGRGLATRRLGAPQVRGFGRRHVHDVVGAGDAPAATLHVYAPRLTLMNRYDIDEQGRLRLTSTEAEGVDW